MSRVSAKRVLKHHPKASPAVLKFEAYDAEGAGEEAREGSLDIDIRAKPTVETSNETSVETCPSRPCRPGPAGLPWAAVPRAEPGAVRPGGTFNAVEHESQTSPLLAPPVTFAHPPLAPEPHRPGGPGEHRLGLPEPP